MRDALRQKIYVHCYKPCECRLSKSKMKSYGKISTKEAKITDKVLLTSGVSELCVCLPLIMVTAFETKIIA